MQPHSCSPATFGRSRRELLESDAFVRGAVVSRDRSTSHCRMGSHALTGSASSSWNVKVRRSGTSASVYGPESIHIGLYDVVHLHPAHWATRLERGATLTWPRAELVLQSVMLVEHVALSLLDSLPALSAASMMTAWQAHDGGRSALTTEALQPRYIGEGRGHRWRGGRRV